MGQRVVDTIFQSDENLENRRHDVDTKRMKCKKCDKKMPQWTLECKCPAKEIDETVGRSALIDGSLFQIVWGECHRLVFLRKLGCVG